MSRDLKVVDKHLRHWRGQGLVDADHEARLRASSEELDRSGVSTVLRTALALLGGALVLAGLTLVVAENWMALPRGVKLAGWAIFLAAFVAASEEFARRFPDRPALAEAFALAAGGWVLAGIALVEPDLPSGFAPAERHLAVGRPRPARGVAPPPPRHRGGAVLRARRRPRAGSRGEGLPLPRQLGRGPVAVAGHTPAGGDRRLVPSPPLAGAARLARRVDVRRRTGLPARGGRVAGARPLGSRTRGHPRRGGSPVRGRAPPPRPALGRADLARS